MYIKISGGDNKNSCSNLVDYLGKESKENGATSLFFNNEIVTEFRNESYVHLSKDFTSTEVKEAIDQNHFKLTKNDAKFYMITINPSHKELCHLAGVKENITPKELTKVQRIKINSALKGYTNQVMGEYARNFNRENVRDEKDLLYFAKIETNRTYKHYDKEVIEGSKKPGDKKEGLNFHVHVIVSRKSKDGKVKLSPLAKSKGDSFELNGKKVQRGFNYEAFAKKSCELFNSKYNYKYNTYKNHDKEYVPKTSTGKQVGKQITNNKLISKVKQEVKQSLTGNENPLANEKKMLARTTTIINLFRSPVSSLFKEGVKELIKGG